MDLTPQTLREVEFREKLRGYHPDDVDDFLEAVAVGLEGLLGRLQTAEAIATVVAAETPSPAATLGDVEVVSPSAVLAPVQDVTEDTLRRTLLLAQRTADAAVADAEASARKVLDTATSEANRIVAEAEAKVSTATREARARTESAVADLEQRRIGLEREVAALQAWATQQRDRLRDVLSDQMRALDIWLATSGTPRPLGAGRGAPRLAAVEAEPPVEPAPTEETETTNVVAPEVDDGLDNDAAGEPRDIALVAAEDAVAPADDDGATDDGGARLGGRLFRRQ